MNDLLAAVCCAQMGGEVRYNGQLPSQFDLHCTASYVDQASAAAAASGLSGAP